MKQGERFVVLWRAGISGSPPQAPICHPWQFGLNAGAITGFSGRFGFGADDWVLGGLVSCLLCICVDLMERAINHIAGGMSADAV